MIALDTSAVLAVALLEADFPKYVTAIEERVCLVGVPTRVEMHVVAMRRGGDGLVALIDDLMARPNIRLVDADERMYEAARAAFDRFGVGRSTPPAVLNFGDCLAYAVARVHGVPLLYKGDDFARTDIPTAE